MLHQMPRAAAPAPETSEGPSATVALAELRLASNRLGRVVERWNTIPAIGCVRIRFKSDRLTLEATDLKMTLTLDLEAQTSGRADLVVSHRALAGFLRAARGPVTITYMRGEDHDRVRLSDGEVRVTLQLSIPPEDFPQPFKDLDPDWMRNAGAFTLSGAQALRLFDLEGPVLRQPRRDPLLSQWHLPDHEARRGHPARRLHRRLPPLLQGQGRRARWPATSATWPG